MLLKYQLSAYRKRAGKRYVHRRNPTTAIDRLNRIEVRNHLPFEPKHEPFRRPDGLLMKYLLALFKGIAAGIGIVVVLLILINWLANAPRQ